ncbi:MAG: AMP-binding protein [Gemmatimonadota bacterium]|nr:AMP-binding protein [Gemmatimonadota bacterium]
MSDPLALLPLAAAAGGGSINEIPATRLVAAGLTLLQRCAPLVRALDGRRSAILLPAGPAFLTALAASDGRGAVLINPLAAPAEIAMQLADANVGAVFTVAPLAARLPAGVPRVLLDDAPRAARYAAGGDSREVDLGSHHGLALEGAPGAEGRDEEAAIVYTSAMAGRPLGAILTHRNLLANAWSTVKAVQQSADHHVLALLPFAHLFGLTVTGIAPLLAGARVTTMDRFNPARAAELLAAGGVTEVVGVPAIFAVLLAAGERRRAGVGALRVCICGGAPLAPELQERWFDVTGVELRQGYGLTEAAPVCLFNRPDRPNARGTMGTAFPDVEVTVRAPSAGGGGVTPELPRGESGEICVRGANVFRGYVSGGEAGLAVRGGWLYTGDRGAMAADGTVAFRGVLKAMFTRNGFNIYPEEIRRAVGELAGVREVVVRAVPEPTREHDIALDVRGTVTADDVRAWCESRLSGYKQPVAVVVDA